MRKLAVLHATSLGMLVAITAVACGSNDEGLPTPGAGSPVEFTQQALVAPQSIVDAVKVEDNALRFSRSLDAETVAKLTVGTVFAGGDSRLPGTSNTDGFLRKVVAIREEGEDIVLDTEPAALTDLLVRGEFSVTSDTLDFGAKTLTAGGVETQTYEKPADLDGYKFKYEIPQRVLASFQETVQGENGSAGVTGMLELQGAHFAIDPKIKFSGGVSASPLGGHVEAKLEGRMHSAIGIKASVGASANGSGFSFTKDYEKSFGTIDQEVFAGDPQALPEVSFGPLKVRPKAALRVNITCERAVAYGAAKVEAGVVATGTVNANAGFSTSDGFKFDFDKTFDVQPSWSYEAEGNLSAKCDVDARVAVSIFGSYKVLFIKGDLGQANAEVQLNAGIEGDLRGNASSEGGAQACGQYSGYLRANASVSAKILKKDFGTKEYELADLTFGENGQACEGGDGDGGTAPPDSCAGKEDGAYCSSLFSGAVRCANGSLDTLLYCEDSSKKCKAGENGQATPVVDEQNPESSLHVECE